MNRNILYLVLPILLFSCSIDDSGNGGSQIADQGPLSEVAQNNKVWAYVSDLQMVARNGTTSGYLASLNADSDKLLIYFQGGGACYNPITCDGNPNQFGNTEANQALTFLNTTPLPIYNRQEVNNQFQEWNYIFVPYSSGDLHSGNNLFVDIPFNGPENQQMQGSQNFDHILDDIRQFYQGNSLSEIVVTGSSAGGYGVYLNFPKVADAYPQAQMTGLVDAGPIFLDNTASPDCLFNSWENLFQFDYPDDFNAEVNSNYDHQFQGVYEYLANKYPQHNFGLMADYFDETLRFFYGFGDNDCDENTVQVSPQDFETATKAIQNTLSGYSNWKVFFDNTNDHTFLITRYLTESVQGTTSRDWIEDLTKGQAQDLME